MEMIGCGCEECAKRFYREEGLSEEEIEQILYGTLTFSDLVRKTLSEGSCDAK